MDVQDHPRYFEVNDSNETEDILVSNGEGTVTPNEDPILHVYQEPSDYITYTQEQPAPKNHFWERTSPDTTQGGDPPIETVEDYEKAGDRDVELLQLFNSIVDYGLHSSPPNSTPNSTPTPSNRSSPSPQVLWASPAPPPTTTRRCRRRGRRASKCRWIDINTLMPKSATGQRSPSPEAVDIILPSPDESVYPLSPPHFPYA